MKSIIGIFFLLSIGFIVGRSTVKVPSSEVTEDSDEIISLKNRIAVLEKELASTKVPVPSPMPVLKESRTEILDAAKPTSDVPVEIGAPPAVEPRSGSKKWRSAERTIPMIRTMSEVPAFLEKVKIQDFLSEVQSLQPITQGDEIVEVLNGNYVGMMSTQSEVPNFNITLDARLNTRNQVLQGRLSIRLSRNGRVFSRGSSSGDIQNVQKFGTQSAAVIIYSDKYYFQLYHMPGLDTFEGNCYQQDKPGSMKYVGTVHLDKVN